MVRLSLFVLTYLLNDSSGVVNSKWHSKKKVSVQARLRLSLANDEADFSKREAIYNSLRSHLCAEFR